MVGAHPDDGEIGAGGLIAANDSIILSVTNGANDSRSWRIAREEMENSASILGCKPIIWDYPMDVHCSAQLVAQIDELLYSNEIDTLVTHFVQDTNQAHREVAEAAISAARGINNVLMTEPSPPASRSWHAFRPQLYTDISSVYEKKWEALRAYRSQMEKYGESWMDGAQARELLRGWECGTYRAEAYEVIRLLI